MKKDNHITAFYIEVLLLTLVLIGIVLVLTQIFALGRKESASARELTDAVCLAQNAAEAFSAADSPESLFALLDEGGNAVLEAGTVTASYGADMKPDPEGVLRVEVERIPGSRQTAEVTVRVVRRDTGEEIYSLVTAAYFPEDLGE